MKILSLVSMLVVYSGSAYAAVPTGCTGDQANLARLHFKNVKHAYDIGHTIEQELWKAQFHVQNVELCAGALELAAFCKAKEELVYRILQVQKKRSAQGAIYPELAELSFGELFKLRTLCPQD